MAHHGPELLSRYPVYLQSLREASVYLGPLGAERDILETFGLHPTIVVGHPSGEIAAAFCYGAITRYSALKLALREGNGDEEQQSVGVVVGCVNSPKSITLSDKRSRLGKLQVQFKKDNVLARLLPVPVGYDSFQMQELLTKKIDGSHPEFVGVDVLVEVGPHAVLRGPCCDTLLESNHTGRAEYLSALLRDNNGTRTLLEAMGQLNCLGAQIDFKAVITMAIVAIKQATDDAATITGSELKNVNFRAGSDGNWFGFTLCSYDGSWVTNCDGTIQAITRSKPVEAVSHIGPDVRQVVTRDMAKACTTSLDASQFYEMLGSFKYQFELAFVRIANIAAGISPTGLAGPSCNGIKVGTKIESVGRQEFASNISAYGGNGDVPLIFLDGLVIANIDSQAPASDADEEAPATKCQHIDWKPDLHLMTPAEIQQYCNDTIRANKEAPTMLRLSIDTVVSGFIPRTASVLSSAGCPDKPITRDANILGLESPRKQQHNPIERWG
ncbi:hypothetical protein BDW71DRAFT_208877 [Aspergillus fruticulosus]